jgi:hypothetical protein
MEKLRGYDSQWLNPPVKLGKPKWFLQISKTHQTVTLPVDECIQDGNVTLRRSERLHREFLGSKYGFVARHRNFLCVRIQKKAANIPDRAQKEAGVSALWDKYTEDTDKLENWVPTNETTLAELEEHLVFLHSNKSLLQEDYDAWKVAKDDRVPLVPVCRNIHPLWLRPWSAFLP